MNNATNSCGSKKCDTANRSIGCTVTQCKYHCDSENYCSLDKIQVVTHEGNPTESKCTDCATFMPKQQ